MLEEGSSQGTALTSLPTLPEGVVTHREHHSFVVDGQKVVLAGGYLPDVGELFDVHRLVYEQFARPGGTSRGKHVHGAFLLNDLERVERTVRTNDEHALAGEADLLDGGGERSDFCEFAFAVGLLAYADGGNFGLRADV